MRWDTFLAVEFWALLTMATTLATAASLAATRLIRWRSRPEVEWTVVPDKRYGRPNTDGGLFTITAKASNVGDGYAFRVAARGIQCEAALQGEPQPSAWGYRRFDVSHIPIAEPGEECPVKIRCTLADWDQAEVIIEWTESPTRRRKRRREPIPLREIRPAPDPDAG